MKPMGIGLPILFASLVVLLGQSDTKAAPDDVEARPVQNVAGRQFVMDDANFEANVFNPYGNARQARTRIETKLKLQLDELNRVCDLTESQQKKLKLAAGSDIKRLFDEVDAVRRKYRAGNQDQQAWQAVWQEIQPLQVKISSGLFDDASFFAKTIRKTLTEEQAAKYDAIVGERRRFHYRSSIEVVMTSMENSVPLRHEQHEAIVKLLLDETQPPAAFGQHDQYLVMYRLARLPEAKLKPLLEERQWQQLKIQLNQARGMEPFLVQNGLIAKEEVEQKQPTVRVRRTISPASRPADAAQPENQPQARQEG